MTPAELAITSAMEAVESLPASALLTEAVELLGRARTCVADYVDGTKCPECDDLIAVGGVCHRHVPMS